MARPAAPIDESAYFLGLALDRIVNGGEPVADAGIANGFADEFLYEPDQAEAERFRREIERDARGSNDHWPDGS